MFSDSAATKLQGLQLIILSIKNIFMKNTPELVKCPECLQPVNSAELVMFSGVCEDCTIKFSNDEDDEDDEDDLLY